jgi:hypothetical protein
VLGGGSRHHGTHGSTRAARAGTQEPRPHDTWMCVSGRLALRLYLELIRRGTRSAGYRQWPLGPRRERQQTCGWGQHLFPTLLF